MQFQRIAASMLLILALSLRVAIAQSETTLATPSPSHPNILLAIADDQSFGYTSYDGCKIVSTPAFDRIARQGVYFTHAYSAAPSCTASRASLLTGRPMWALGVGANLTSTLDKSFAVYPDLLEHAGYLVGFTAKGWGPGDVTAGGRTRNPAGEEFNDARGPRANVENFRKFLAARKPNQPFCFWFGSHDPHRPYQPGSGVAAGKKLSDVVVPPFLPDSDAVRSDLLDYAFAIDREDRDLSEMLAILEANHELANTLIIATGDNGLPFPRAKANLYDAGTHQPLAIWWPGHTHGGRRVDDFTVLTDLASTILDAAGVPPAPEMTRTSLLPILLSGKTGQVDPARDRAYFGLERHTQSRPGKVGYPCRAIRTKDFLYIHNYAPDRWPASDPPRFTDIDPANNQPPGTSKDFLITHQDDPAVRSFFQLATSKRPEEELYDLSTDPDELHNVAADVKYAEKKKELRANLDTYLKQTGDPRETGAPLPWDIAR